METADVVLAGEITIPSSGGARAILIAIKLINEEEISRSESIREASIDCDSVASQP